MPCTDIANADIRACSDPSTNHNCQVDCKLNELFWRTVQLTRRNSGPYTLAAMAKRRTSARPAKQRAAQANMVAAAVELAGGVPAVARLCGVSRQSVYSWIREWRVERLTDALKLSQESGIPVEKFAGQTLGSKPAKPRKSPT